MSVAKALQDITEGLDDLIKVQCSDGNWDYDEYMRGMANGLILARTLIDGNDPEYLEPPEIYLQAYAMLDDLIEKGVVLNPSDRELEDYRRRNIPVVAEEK